MGEVRVPDTPENRAEFGAGNGRTVGGYPIVRIVTLMVLRSHLLLAARFGPYRVSERKHARDLWPSVPDDSLVVADRNFLDARDLWPLQSGGTNRHWLSRARKNNKWRVVRRLGPGDALAEVLVNRDARRQEPSLPERWTMRAIRYRRRGFREQTLLTSLLDPVMYPAQEIVALYHERWEIELGFDEVKTEIARARGGHPQQEPRRFARCLGAIRIHLLRFAAISPGKLARMRRATSPRR